MKAYKLQFVMYDPSESTEPDKYMAEDALDILQDVAAAIIETHIERGYELPEEAQSRTPQSI